MPLEREDSSEFFLYPGFLSQTFTIHRTAGEGEAISLAPLYHFHLIHWQLYISRAISTKSSGNFWFQSKPRKSLEIICSYHFTKTSVILKNGQTYQQDYIARFLKYIRSFWTLSMKELKPFQHYLGHWAVTWNTFRHKLFAELGQDKKRKFKPRNGI